MSTNQNQLSNKLDATSAYTVIKSAFPNVGDFENFQIQFGSDGSDIKLFDAQRLYSVSAIMARHHDDISERWIYSVLFSNQESRALVWKYVHPITNAVYSDPAAVDYKTLPYIS